MIVAMNNNAITVRSSQSVSYMQYALIVFLISIYSLFLTTPLQAQMTEVNDTELSLISAQAGISMNFGMNMRITTDSFKFSDTDHDPVNWIEFNNITVSGPGGSEWFSASTPVFPYWTFDIATDENIDGTSRTFTHMFSSDMVNPRTYQINNFVFCNQDLGSILLDSMSIGPDITKISSHTAPDSSGLEIEYLTKRSLANAYYTYNSAGDSLHVKGLSLCGTTGTGDDPADPSTWNLGGQFRFGDLFGGVIDNVKNPGHPNPVTFDVGTDTSTDPSNTIAVVNIPMKGIIRVADVNFGGTDFGPCAIDNITVHHLLIKLSGE